MLPYDPLGVQPINGGTTNHKSQTLASATRQDRLHWSGPFAKRVAQKTEVSGLFGEHSAALQTLPRATGAKKSEKKSPGASGPGVPKSLEKVSKKSRTDIFEICSRLFGLFPDFWGLRGRRLFSDFLGISGPEGPRDSCGSREGSQV